jgi:hypothetical protein
MRGIGEPAAPQCRIHCVGDTQIHGQSRFPDIFEPVAMDAAVRPHYNQ